MLIFHQARLVVFSIPRTGSTSLHDALRPFADIEYKTPPNKKHMTVRRFEMAQRKEDRRVLDYTRVAVMRDPLMRLQSWYRYRQRPAAQGKDMSTEAMSFEEFIAASLGEGGPAAAQIGNQHRFVTRADGNLGIDELFCIERADVMMAYFRSIFGALALPHRNAAPRAPVALSAGLEAKLREARADEFALFNRVLPTGRLTR